MSESCPIELEDLLASIAEVLKEHGNARELAILVNAKRELRETYYDNWNGGTSTWGLSLGLDIRFYTSIKQDVQAASKILLEAGQEFFVEFENHGLGSVTIVSAKVSNPQWEAEAVAYISGKGITNQGRVRSDNPAPRTQDGLLFRSQAEINLYLALKVLGLTFAPLPVFLRGGKPPKRFEPDFVIVKGGVMTVVEVDGDNYHRELPADAQERLRPLEDEGAVVFRVKASECDTPEKAKLCAVKVLEFIDKKSRLRG